MPSPKPAVLPADLRLDATIPEVMAFRRESARTTYRKLASGVYRSHKNGDRRLIEWQSVFEDRARCIAQGSQLPLPTATAKRRVGRPRKPRPDDHAHAAE